MDNVSIINERLTDLHAVDLETANRDLEAIIRSNEFITEAKYALRHDEFFEQALERFTFQIVEKSPDSFCMDEPDYGCIFNTERFELQLYTFEDLLAQVIHTCLHEWCEIAWLSTPVSKQKFNAIELDVLEEIYGQALMYKIAPDLHHLFSDNLRHYFESVNEDSSKTYPVFDQIFDLFGRNLDTTLEDPTLNAARVWLYAQDPTEPQTFWKYITLCEALVSKTNLRELIQEYYRLLGHKIEWA